MGSPPVVDGERRYVYLCALTVQRANRAAGEPDGALTVAIDELLRAVRSSGVGDPFDVPDADAQIEHSGPRVHDVKAW